MSRRRPAVSVAQRRAADDLGDQRAYASSQTSGGFFLEAFGELGECTPSRAELLPHDLADVTLSLIHI